MAAIVIAVACSACTYDFDSAFGGVGGQGGQAPAVGGGPDSGGSGGSGATGGGPSDELCFNGVDDDDDGAADCADPDCRGAVCAPEAPPGWSGPATLHRGDADEVPTCPETLTEIAGGAGDLTAPPAACEACSCGTPTGGVCGIGTTTLYASNSVCAGDIATVVQPPTPNVCHSFAPGDQSTQATGEPIPVEPVGSCEPAGGTATVPPATFAEPWLLCTASAGTGCGDEVCVPAATAPSSELCVFTEGDVPCPTEIYRSKRTIFTDIDDSRECTDCACAPPIGQTCTGTTNLYTGGSCNNLVNSVAHDGTTCESYDILLFSGSALFVPDAGPSGGSCAASGGEPDGTATATGLTTVCCRP